MIPPSDSLSLTSSSSISEDIFQGGLSNPQSIEFKKRRQLLEVVHVLRGSGVDLHLDLPQIAVVGSQSVGKSSLIEAISGITLPRASGTCTRCPIECTLTSSTTEWQCQISLRFSVNEKDQPLPTTRNIPFGETIKDKVEVEERIRRAQFAILNPKRDPASFLNAPLSSLANDMWTLSFSSNCISVRISGKGVDDLSFVDLPGIIASVREGQDEKDIQRVKSLVKKHIEKPSCLILLVVSCETDLENQGARELAKRINPSGERIIPVLTKPDRIPPGEEPSWLLLLRNSRERHKHGWHCVKQPSSDEMREGITWAEARDAESVFFTETEPWASLDAYARSRLGTVPLTKALGEILFALIAKRLPELLTEVDGHLSSCKKDLATLPVRTISDPVGEVWRLLSGFKHDVEELVAGRPDDGSQGLIQIVRGARQEFREAIFKGAPRFRPWTKPTTEVELPTTPQDTFDGLEPRVSASDTVVYANEVMDRAKTSITRELPYNYPYAVKIHYVKRFTAMWPGPAETLFQEVERNFEKDLGQIVRIHFNVYRHGGLESKIYGLVFEHLHVCTQLAHERMMQCIQLEHEEPMTVNEDTLSDLKSKFLTHYRAMHRTHNGTDSTLKSFISGAYDTSSYFTNALANLRSMGFQGLTRQDLLRLLKPDGDEEALEIMAECRAYYQVAYKRFADYVPMIIDYHLLKGFNRTIHEFLFRSLELGEEDARDRCAAYLEEEPEIVNRRLTLSSMLNRMEITRIELLKALASSSTVIDAVDDDIRPFTPLPLESHEDEIVSEY